MISILHCCLLLARYLDSLEVLADNLIELMLRCCYALVVGFLWIRFELRFEPAPWARSSHSR